MKLVVQIQSVSSIDLDDLNILKVSIEVRHIGEDVDAAIVNNKTSKETT